MAQWLILIVTVDGIGSWSLVSWLMVGYASSQTLSRRGVIRWYHKAWGYWWRGRGASDRFAFFKLLIPRSNQALYTYVMFIKVRDNYKRVLAVVAIGLGLLVWTVFGILFCVLQIFYFKFLKFLGKCYGNVRYE